MKKKCVISYSGLFQIAFGTPWIINVEGSTECYRRATEQAARDYVENTLKGELVAVHKGEQAIIEKWKSKAV